MGQYIWQRKGWPKLVWDSEQLIELLGRARKEQGGLFGQAGFIGLEDKANFLIEEALKTSSIEGELLDKESVRSSVAKRLGLPTRGLPAEQRHIEGLVEMLIDANTQFSTELNEQRLFGWHAALFPTGYSGLTKINVGQWRKTTEPMQVVSGAIGKEVVHYEAPELEKIKAETKAFLRWWNNPPKKLDGLIRAAVAHLWFVTIHPFEDGNGRITRAITDMALAQDENSELRLYSLSSQIEKEKKQYYSMLERTQKSDIDITVWIEWFLKMYIHAIERSYEVISKALYVAKFWQRASQSELNKRQIKAVQKMIESEPKGFVGGMTNRKYVSLTQTSRETAKRDLSDLEKRAILIRNKGKGRSVSYALRVKMKKVNK